MAGSPGPCSVAEMPTVEFFCWKYLPTIVMVTYGVLWQIADYEVKRLEPYYQLSQPTGNTAAQSLNLDYVTLWSYTVPIKAVKYRHWAVFVSSIGTILATTAAPSLQSPSINSVESPECKDSHKPACDGVRYFLRIDPVWSRLVTTCLITVALLALVLLVQLRRKYGLLSDPRGVAGIAAMATKSHILRDFDGMDEALHDDIHAKLRHRRYILYKSTIWQGEYTHHDPPKTHTQTQTQNPHPIILRPIPLMSFMIAMAIFLLFIPAIAYTPLKTITHSTPLAPHPHRHNHQTALVHARIQRQNAAALPHPCARPRPPGPDPHARLPGHPLRRARAASPPQQTLPRRTGRHRLHPRGYPNGNAVLALSQRSLLDPALGLFVSYHLHRRRCPPYRLRAVGVHPLPQTVYAPPAEHHCLDPGVCAPVADAG